MTGNQTADLGLLPRARTPRGQWAILEASLTLLVLEALDVGERLLGGDE